ncbi:MAG: CRISPR-associated endonuclease Cas3'' [Candidatus Jordarchaeaceae archaeon]
MEYSWNKPFLSHPSNRPLKEHLKDVGEACVYYLKAAKVTNENFVKTAEIVGKTHDFGKYSTFFQRYLENPQSQKKFSHAPLSAIFASWIVSREFKDPFLTATAYLCVLRHHGNLTNFYDVLNHFQNSAVPQSQLDSIGKNLPRISKELSEIGIYGVDEFFGNIDKIKNDLKKELFNATRKRETSWDEYFKTLLLFSALIDADKKDAAKIRLTDRYLLPPDLVDKFRQKVFNRQTPMDTLRSELYESVMRSLEKLVGNQPSITTITAPTGSGKTLLSLSVALKLREKLAERGDPPRIIYCLPFINIIEQTYDVFSRVLESGGIDINPAVLLKHHHLAIPSWNEEKSLHEALELQESWESEITVTTYVQLMHTLVGYRNSFLKKFHNLANAIIILDEIQTVPIEYWLLTKKLFKNLTGNMQSHIIFMTATQPLIFSEEEAKELVPNSSKYFEGLDRTRLHYNPNEMGIKEAANLIYEKWMKRQSILAVANTIQSSIK